jgi:hypothetical protein
MNTLTHRQAEEVADIQPPKNTVEEGDVFFDQSNGGRVEATSISDSSGWRYLAWLTPNGTKIPDGTVPDSDLLDPRLFTFLYRAK